MIIWLYYSCCALWIGMEPWAANNHNEQRWLFAFGCECDYWISSGIHPSQTSTNPLKRYSAALFRYIFHICSWCHPLSYKVAYCPPPPLFRHYWTEWYWQTALQLSCIQRLANNTLYYIKHWCVKLLFLTSFNLITYILIKIVYFNI